MLSGGDAWHTVEITEAGVPSVKFTDGANGVRNENIVASCFPSPVAVASSFDENAAFSLGSTIADECRHFGMDILLAPSMNIKRTPLCGRNFGYYSEDPVVSGKTAAAFVNGVQSKGVGACLKHFAAYNKENQRMTYDSTVDNAALREIYLKGFEIAVKASRPTCVMTSYNFCNSVHASENAEFITDILRGEWGFDGVVVSDWGGVSDRVSALKAGLDLEMPLSPYGIEKIRRAFARGEITEEEIDTSCERVAALARKFKGTIKPCDFEKSKEVALDVALKSRRGRKVVEKYLLGYLYMAMFGTFNGDITLEDEVAKSPFFTGIMNDMPLRALCNLTLGKFGDDDLENVIDILNGKKKI